LPADDIIESPNDVCVIGPGRLGSTLVVNLERAGFAVRCVLGRATVEDGEGLGELLAGYLAEPLVVWLCVPDDAIAGVARRVAGALPAAPAAPVTVVHSSGLGSLALLDDARAAGARVLGLHPLQTFAGGAPDPQALAGVPFAVTAADADGAAVGRALVRRLGGVPFDLPDDAKSGYHLAAAVASNLLVALESEADDLLAAAAGLMPAQANELLAPLVATTVANLRETGPEGALTGPVARGDVGTVRAHLDLLAHRSPRFVETYQALSLQALALAAPRLDDETVRALRALLSSSQEARP
jgi:predicted short-subunit dehydrogenase-like oxidoreductase (DUF2520 family)